MKIAVVILNYNGLNNTLECIESLKKQSLDDLALELIVLDNASTDNSGEVLRDLKDIIFIQNENNLGYSGGNNVGIKRALENNADFVCVLNNDVKVDKNFFINLLNSNENSIVSPKIYFYPGFEFHENKYKRSELGKIIWYAGGTIDWDNIIGIHRGVDEVDHGQYNETQEIDFATGACIFAKSEIFKKIGLFDEKYFLYLEDMDLSFRAKKMGFQIIYEPRAVMWHKNAASAGGSGSRTQDYYISRNRLLFAFKHAKLRTKLAVLRQIISQSKDPVRRAALTDFIKMKFGMTSRTL